MAISGYSFLYRLPITVGSHYTLAPSERDIEVLSAYPLIRLDIALFHNYIETGLPNTKKTQGWACQLHTLHAKIFKLPFAIQHRLHF